MPCTGFLQYSSCFDDYKDVVKRNCATFDLSYKEQGIHDLYMKYRKTKKVGFRHGGFCVTFYTSDVDIIKEIQKFVPKQVQVYEADTPPDNVRYLARPKYAYRTYLRTARMSKESIQCLENFCNNYSSQINMCGSLKRSLDAKHWFHRSASWMYNSYFIEYNDEQLQSLLYLTCSECIGKTFKMEKK